MEHARTNWNDDRLDRLADQVDEVRRRVDDLRSHMDERFDAQDAKFDAKFDALQRSMIITLAGILAAFGSAFLGFQL